MPAQPVLLNTQYLEDLNPDAAVVEAAREGLTASRKWLVPWLFYDAAGSDLFEQITRLPEYYLTRTERALFEQHADQIVALAAGEQQLMLAELGAGTATKTGILLSAIVARQGSVVYEPVDVSPTALDEATRALQRDLPGVRVLPQIANYITSPIRLERVLDARSADEPGTQRILALYIGSSIGNFSPEEARSILRNLRAQLAPGDSLLLGTDLAPGATKTAAELVAAYDDAAGVTAAFNRNMLVRLNRKLGADFDLEAFAHEARWNATESRMEMHLRSLRAQTVTLPAVENVAGRPLKVTFAADETIHTENSYKFTRASIDALLAECGFTTLRQFTDDDCRYAVTLATAV